MRRRALGLALVLVSVLGSGCARWFGRPATTSPPPPAAPAPEATAGTAPATATEPAEGPVSVGSAEPAPAARSAEPSPPPDSAAVGEPAAPAPTTTGSATDPLAPVPPIPPIPQIPQIPELVRVGLATDLTAIRFPCCGGDLVAEAGEAGSVERVAVVATLVVEPAPSLVAASVYRLQVAALKDEGQARGLAANLESDLGEPADAVFDAGIDLYRVRIGRYQERDAAEAFKRTLAGRGIDTWVVSEGGGVVDPAFRITQKGESRRVAGRWIAVRGEGEKGIQVEGGRYRGRILIFLNDRGMLNLVNEVSLENYLRGVVPREMGPAIYSNLDALKAQAVAARSYALKNLAEFSGEGYDICATPRCQVYGGIEAEHPLSDRAVAETAGEVLLWRGQLVDALYSSTCGGHTENVEVVFPAKHYPYLRGVPCLEGGVDQLAGDLASGAPFPGGLTGRLLPVPPPAAGGEGAGREGAVAAAPDTGAGRPDALAARLDALARAAGLPPVEDRLGSLARREVQRYLASRFDLALDARLFVAAEDLPYLLEDPPADWTDADRRLAAYLVKSGLLSGRVQQPVAAAEIEEMLLQLALYLRVAEEREARYLDLGGGELRVREGEEERLYPLPATLATFRRLGGETAAAPLALLAGDRLTLYLRGEELIAVVHEVDRDGAAFDRASNMASWTRLHSDSKLAAAVRTRYPELDLEDFEVLSRGVSGRVGAIRLHGRDGRTEEVDGLAVRWTLDVPDTWFSAKRLAPGDREPGWLFTGHGWGHGVGMCQVGAYGMSQRGHDYREILQHYYTGVEVARLEVEGSGEGEEAAGAALRDGRRGSGGLW